MSVEIIGIPTPQFEPGIISDNGRDGISVFQFSVVGRSVSMLYPIDAVVNDVPGQPVGSFRVVRRNLENIVEGLQRISVSAEGGSQNGLYISESGYQYNESQEDGLINLPFAQIKVQYKLVWLSASVTVTTNSGGASAGPAESIAQQIIASMPVQIKKDRPANVSVGRKIDTSTIIITGSSIEKAGGLWRVRATASKGILPT
jgi:hypothetical protein